MGPTSLLPEFYNREGKCLQLVLKEDRIVVKKRLLVIDAHSDDSLISSAGLFDRFRDIYEYHFILVACSDIYLHHCGQVSRVIRMQEYHTFVSYFGGIWHHNEILPFDADSLMDTIPKSKVISAIESIIQDVQPEVMICHGPSFHQDHTITYEATLAAIRPTARFMPQEFYIAENPTYFHSIGPHTDIHPNFYVRLTEDDMEKKIVCLRKFFPSQIRDSGNYLSPEGIKSWARYRGIEARCEYAEAFQTFIRVV